VLYGINPGTWDTNIEPTKSDSSHLVIWPPWDQAKEYTVAYLDRILAKGQYTDRPRTDSHPGNDQMDAEIRDYIAQLRQDIAESASWREYAERRCIADEDDAVELFRRLLFWFGDHF